MPQKQGVKWALAGRNKQKLEGIRENLCKIDPSVKVSPLSSLLPAKLMAGHLYGELRGEWRSGSMAGFCTAKWNSLMFEWAPSMVVPTGCAHYYGGP